MAAPDLSFVATGCVSFFVRMKEAAVSSMAATGFSPPLQVVPLASCYCCTVLCRKEERRSGLISPFHGHTFWESFSGLGAAARLPWADHEWSSSLTTVVSEMSFCDTWPSRRRWGSQGEEGDGIAAAAASAGGGSGGLRRCYWKS